MSGFWHTAKRKIAFRERTLVMGILNCTPDSFSDGGRFFSIEDALAQAEKLVADGADILDVGGESTRPNSRQISKDEEISRVAPVIEAVAKRFAVPISVDTTKAAVAEAAINAGAEIINDISGLRFDERMAATAARTNAGLVLMDSRGNFAEMHEQPPLENIVRDISENLSRSIEKAESGGVKRENIMLDVGIGFSKTFENNLELLAKLNELVEIFSEFPMLVGASRKSFIGKVSGVAPVEERLNGSLAAAAIAVWNGANVVRVHDVEATIESLKIVEAIKSKF